MQLRNTITAALAAASFALGVGPAFSQGLTNVPSANSKIPGVTSATVLSPQLAQIVRAQGSMLVENPTDTAKYHGYLNNQPNLLPAPGSNIEFYTQQHGDNVPYEIVRNPGSGDERDDDRL